ncbi:hypothetical protein ACIBHX_40480 [Nonomuraea sp. NPDC050536]|uniref:hypothetical protein n=1 Tax=Nonomuraea sp. NPDC050536 TaxID=3364366 RepID=UPI0037C97786
MKFRHLAVVLVAAACTACSAAQPGASQREALPSASAQPRATAKAGSGELCHAIEKLDPKAAMEHAQQGAEGMRKAAGTFEDLAAVAPAEVAADLRHVAGLYRRLADGQIDPATVANEVGPPYQRYLAYISKHCVGG